ncbi:MAG: ROK family protein [Anaerolineaceae bacterium]|nr:ROK family protein [Anaerolineaceae bacterium]
MKQPLFAGIEGGGTKFVCAVADENNQILAERRVATTDPAETLAACAEFFQQQAHLGTIQSLGIACFGPLDPRPTSEGYGRILATPKPGWSGADVVGFFRQRLSLPIAFDTDVNGAVLAESLWGAGKGLRNLVYFTIGTGIGAGIIAEGNLVHGFLHPEMGHILLARDPEQDPFPGVCPFHGACFEGLASGPAIEKRWGLKGDQLPRDHQAWDLEAEYIAKALVSVTCALAPERIILGGGVMAQEQLLPMIREKFVGLLNGYMQTPLITEQLESYLVLTGLEGKAGLYGAFALAQQAWEQHQ